MAIRNIVQLGEAVLRTVAKEVSDFDDRLHMLIDDMIETMIDADGIGLAANQVGILKRVFVISLDLEKYYEFVNPRIVEYSGSEIFEEGCLSILGVKGNVERPSKIKVVAQDRNGKEFDLDADGLLARVIQHEYDHLNGVLFVDKVVGETTKVEG
ncbi:MAG: peptide deformylase [Firmicutes bacterium]|nr:peptide deformylase [Bacillota bacterium]MCL1953959.1 peptide deformylase [Bacillota bacterium]